MNSWSQFYIKITQFIILSILTFIFSYRKFTKKIKGYEFLIGALVSALLQSIIETFFFLIRDIVDPQNLITQIELIPYAFVFIFLMLHFENFLGWNFKATYVSLFILFGSIEAILLDAVFNIGAVSIIPTHNLNSMNDRLHMWFFDLFQLYATTIYLIGSILLLINYWFSRARVQVSVLTFGFFIAFVTSILEFLEHLTPVSTYGAIGFGVAIFLILLLYLVDKDFVFVSTIRVFSISIINDNGTPLFAAQHKKLKNRGKYIVGGVINAFTSFICEITGSEYQVLKTIELTDRTIIAKKEGRTIGVIISEKKVKVFESSIDAFVKTFNHEYRDEIEHFTGNIAIFRKATGLLKNIFPYISITDWDID